MVVYRHFRATTFFKAFLLNAILITVTSLCGYFLHYYVKKHCNNLSGAVIVLITVFGTFCITMLSQLLLYYFFAFGEGMLTTRNPNKKYSLFKG
jgi:hypothetical protein